MRMQETTLKSIVGRINNPDAEGGGFWLPHIQRNFVWQQKQICQLFDSIMRQYPISTLLIWKTKADVLHRKFIDVYSKEFRLDAYYVTPNKKRKCLVLDGQQRLQSLFIGFKGGFNNKELYFDVLSGDLAPPDEVKFNFKFRTSSRPTQLDGRAYWYKFKDLVESELDPVTMANSLINDSPIELTDSEKERVAKNVGTLTQTFCNNEQISYQVLDTTEDTRIYTEDDVVEVFIRANSGGTRLTKSDLLFSLLKARWEDVHKEMDDLLYELNRPGFEFTRDFVMKSCLTVLNRGAGYEIKKFRVPETLEEIQEKWDDIANAIKAVLDFLSTNTFITSGKALPSYSVLMPLVYARYHSQNALDEVGIDDYIVRASLGRAFSASSDTLIDSCVNKIKEDKKFVSANISKVIAGAGRNMGLSQQRLWKINYGDLEMIHLLFSLWYRGFNFIPHYVNNLPEVDHIFPRSAFRQPEMKKYTTSDCDQLANCMLLPKGENGPSGKGSKLPDVWFVNKKDDYFEMHCIPKKPELWKLKNFDAFIEARKKLIADKLTSLGIISQSVDGDDDDDE